jgi:hypothetical protein
MTGRIIGFFLCMVSAAAQAQSVRGTVLDATTQKPLPGASISVSTDTATSRKAVSDSAGAFRLTLPRAGLYTVVVSRIGYARHSGDTIRVNAAEIVTLRIEMDQKAIPLHPVVITDRLSRMPPGFEQRRSMGFGRFLDRSEIDNRHPIRTTDLFLGMPGVHLTPLARQAGLLLQLRKPTGYCVPAIYIDGLPLGENRQSLDLMIDSNMLEALELYPSVSTAPVQYRTGDCGIVLFWTRQVPEDAPAKPKKWKAALIATAALGVLLIALTSR